VSENLFRDLLEFVYTGKKSEAVTVYLKESNHINKEEVGVSLESVFNNELFSDVSFLVEQQLIPAHKASRFLIF
jgi:hypothetical protein